MHRQVKGHILAANFWGGAEGAWDPTAVDVFKSSGPTPLTDVISFEWEYTTHCDLDWDGQNFGYNYYGYASCAAVNVANECEQHYIRLDNSDTVNMDWWGHRLLVAHEIGHTLGLAHRNGNIMEANWPQPTLEPSSHSAAHLEDDLQ